MSTAMDWAGVDVQKFGQVPLCIKHRLHEHALFSNEALGRLIELTDRNNYYVNTMDISAHNSRSRREGEINGLSGVEAIEAVAKGRLWILLLQPEKFVPGYRDLVAEIYGEMAAEVPGFEPFGEKLSILISSPRIQVYYHCDVPGQTLWQVRGSKQVYVYPARAPWLHQPSLERIMLGEKHEISMPYEPAFDEGATVYDLQPGEMLHWPLNAPHRIVNNDCLNVSFTTEHYTRDIRRSFIVHCGNGVIRQQLGLKEKSLSRQIEGPNYWSKAAVAAAWKLSGMQKKRRQTFKVDFTVDPAAPDCVRTIPGYEFSK